MNTVTKVLLNATLLVLALDVTGFLAWAMSGQHPVDNFYFGTITAHLIGLFIH